MGQINEKNESLPVCACLGRRAWRDGGCQLGGPLNQMHKVCESCGRVAVELMHEGGHAFLVPSLQSFADGDYEWVNNVLLRTWRDYAARFRGACDSEGAGVLAAVNTALGLPADTKGDTVPSHRYREWSDALNNADEAIRAAVRHRPEFRDGVTPPSVPATVICHTRVRGEWRRHTTEATRDVPVPPDPIRVSHDRFFADLFDAIRVRFQGVLIESTETPNRYYRDEANNEPWYVLSVNDRSIVVGPRKRVIVVAVEGRIRADYEARFAAMAERDRVTYDASGFGVSIHAWGAEKAREYLALAIEAVTGVQPSP